MQFKFYWVVAFLLVPQNVLGTTSQLENATPQYEYDTHEKVAALGIIDPDFEAYVERWNVSSLQDVTRIPGYSSNTNSSNPGQTMDIPMRDNTTSQIRIFKPENTATGSPLVVFIYGGGFITGDNTQYSSTARAVTALYNATVVNISYRLAPTYPFPTAINDVMDSLIWLAAHAGPVLGADLAAGFVVGGGSAGGNLASVATQKWVDERGSPSITGLFASIPDLLDESIVNTTVPAKYRDLWFSRTQNAHSMFLNATDLETIRTAYRPVVTSPDYSPFNSPRAHVGMPKTYIDVGGMDPLRDDGLIYEKVLRDHGVETRIDVYPGLPHAWAILPGFKWSQRTVYNTMFAFGWLLGIEKTLDEVNQVVPGGNWTMG